MRIRLEDANGNEVADGESGEVVVHSGAVTLGYWNDPENTRAALKSGGRHTGELARRDADGYLWFAGRTKDIIIRGGSNIRAYVALKPGTQATEKDLIDWTAKNIAAYKVPETIMFLAALPKGPTGKVLRKALRDQATSS